jgi:hypothetical protein
MLTYFGTLALRIVVATIIGFVAGTVVLWTTHNELAGAITAALVAMSAIFLSSEKGE